MKLVLCVLIHVKLAIKMELVICAKIHLIGFLTVKVNATLVQYLTAIIVLNKTHKSVCNAYLATKPKTVLVNQYVKQIFAQTARIQKLAYHVLLAILQKAVVVYNVQMLQFALHANKMIDQFVRTATMDIIL